MVKNVTKSNFMLFLGEKCISADLSFLATPLEYQNDAPGCHDTQFENHRCKLNDIIKIGKMTSINTNIKIIKNKLKSLMLKIIHIWQI